MLGVRHLRIRNGILFDMLPSGIHQQRQLGIDGACCVYTHGAFAEGHLGLK